jgi:hypothetical protein
VDAPGRVGEEVDMTAVEEALGAGEDVGVGDGLEMFCARNRETNRETVSAATNKTATKINLLCRLRTCIPN